MRTYDYIDTDAKLTSFTGRLKQEKIDTLAMDFEGEFNLHEYGEKLCLIQVFDGKRFSIIDPFGISTEGLKVFLEDRKVLKLFFGAGSDVQLVYKQYKIVLNSVLDLQILAEVAGFQNQGLSGLIEEMFGTVTPNKKKFQMHNWTRRPVDTEALDYALSDVQLLFEMYRVLMQKIISDGKAEAVLRAVVLKTPSSISRGIPGIYKSEMYKALSKTGQALFEKIVAVRESVAKELNWPPENVLGKGAMFDLVNKRLPPEKINRPHRMPEIRYDCLVKDLKEALFS